jgi:glucosamine-6-phosphate isomerase
MEVRIFPDYETLSSFTANEVLSAVKQKPDAMLCFASGDTPKLACRLITERAKSERIDFSKAVFVGLDEWVGIPPENEGSCKYFFQHNLLKPLGMKAEQFHLFDGTANDLQTECWKMDDFIGAKGKIDLMLVGIGVNGHIGFNEPGISKDLYAHVADLHETTKSVGQKYFKSQQKLTQGITLGLAYLIESNKVIIIANGEKKADIVKQTVEGPVTQDVPATIIRKHPSGFVLMDRKSALYLSR